MRFENVIACALVDADRRALDHAVKRAGFAETLVSVTSAGKARTT